MENNLLKDAESLSIVTLPDRVFEQLLTAIVKGEIPAGSKISEPELAKTYGVSRATVREAIGRLEARHLLVRSPNLGARVTSLSAEELLEVHIVREALEGMACRLAARNMTDREIAKLHDLLLEHEKNIELDRGLSYFQDAGELDIHFLIVRGSRNKKLMSILGEELYHLIRMYRYQFSASSARPRQALKEHRRIVDALEDRDGDLAEFLMRRHILAARRRIEERLEKDTRNKESSHE